MSTEFVGIELELVGYEAVRRDVVSLTNLLNSLGGRKKFDMGLKEAKEQVAALDSELKKYQREQANAVKGSAEWQRYEEVIAAVKEQLQGARTAVKEFGLAAKDADRTFKQTFNSWSSKIAHAGSAMQSLGNAMTNISAPFGNLMKGMVFGAGIKVLDSFTSGLENGFNRYDIMKKYPKIMAAFGYSAEEAESSRQKLEQSVLGLPTGLDEMIDLTQRFTATVGDLDKGTKLAIATNNAFLASMSTDTQKYQGMMQLQDVLGGKDMNAREWNSLVSSMTPAIVKMGEAMKESGKWSGSIGDFIQYVREGKMDNQDFIDQLIAIGNEGGVLEAMAQESKDTWQAFFANVGNAASRMTAGVIQSMDEIVKSLKLTDDEGEAIDSVNQLLSKKLIPSIDKTTASIKEWIQTHPEEITDFFQTLSQIHLGEFFRGAGQGLQDIARIVKLLSNVAGDGTLFRWGRRLIRWNATGKLLTGLGGLVKGLRHPGALIATLLRFGGKKLFKGGIFGRLTEILGKKKDITAAGEAAKSVPTIADTFKNVFASLQGIMTAAGAIGIVSVTGFAAFRSVKTMLKDLKEIGDILQDMTWLDAVHGANIIMGIGVMAKIFSAFGTALGSGGLLGTAIAGAAGILVTGSIAADMRLLLDAVRSVKKTITELDEVASAITNMQGITSLDDSVKDKFSNTVEAINEIVNIMKGKSGSPMDRGEVTQGLQGIGRLKLAGINRLGEAVKSLQGFVTNLNALSSMGIASNAVSHVQLIAGAANSVINEMGIFTKSISAPGNLAKNGESLANALIQIRRMAYHINKLGATSVDINGFSAFVGQIKTALAELKSLEGELMLDIEVKLSPLFGSSVEAVKKNIKDAKKDIEKLKSPSVGFNIPVTVTFSVSTNAAEALRKIRENKARIQSAKEGLTTKGYQAGGGYVYRARGGGIGFPGRPRGTDTVPTWLTPGEFVHNKQAVNTFGLDFMRRVNSLDVRGAMGELMKRAGHMASVNHGTHITNNYNNNQQVVQNINTNSADFAFKSASRFVGAF